MNTYYGYTRTGWEKAKDEAREALTEIARPDQGLTITYSALTKRISAITIEPHSYAMAALLGEISTDDHDHGLGMRSALVVSAVDGRAGSGFFALARQLGEMVADEDDFWLRELKKVHADWQDRPAH